MFISRFLSQNQDKIILIIGAVLIAAIGFAAGRLTAFNIQPEPIVIEEPEENIIEGSQVKAEALEAAKQTKEDKQSKEETKTDKESQSEEISDIEKEKRYVGSKSSKKYHYPDCRYAKKIKEENQIWFKSAKEAQEAGYEPCKVCKPPTSN